VANPLQAIVGDFVVTETTFNTLTTSTQVARRDPTRWSILFGLSRTGSSISLSTVSPVTATSGFILVTALSVFVLNFRDVGPLPTLDWFAIQQGIGGGITVVETFYRPAGWEEAGPELLDELAERYRRAGL